MIERFTSSARLSLSFAGYESVAAGRSNISPPHLLLAIMYLYPDVLAQVVRSAGDLRALRQRLIEAGSQPSGQVALDQQFQLDDESRRVLLNAGREARTIWRASTPLRRRLLGSLRRGRWYGRWHVDPHHILLGILGEHRSPAGRLLMEFGASPEAVREMIGRSHAPTTVEPSTVNSLAVVTGEFVDSSLERESRAQLSQFLGSNALRYTRAFYLAILGACYEATRLGADTLALEHLLPGLFGGTVVLLRNTQAVERMLGPILQVRGVIGPDAPV